MCIRDRNTSIRSRNVLRTIFYLPVILSTLIVGQIFQAMLQPDTGLINHILSVFSSSALSFDWLGNPNTAMWMVILVEIWKGAGYCMVIYLAGLQVISKEYYEAALDDPENCLYAPDVISFAREKGYFNGPDEEFSFCDALKPPKAV